MEEDQLREIFSTVGEISSVRFATNEDGSFKGFGHISFYDGNNTDEAIKLTGTDVNGRSIRVDYAPPRAKRESFGSPGGRGGRGGRSTGRDGGRGRGGRSSNSQSFVNKNKGSIAQPAGKKMTFD